MWVGLALDAQALVDGGSAEASPFVMPKARDFTGEIPYARLGEVAKELLGGEDGSTVREILDGLLQSDPAERMSASAAAAKLAEEEREGGTSIAKAKPASAAVGGPAARITRELLSALLQKKLVVV